MPSLTVSSRMYEDKLVSILELTTALSELLGQDHRLRVPLQPDCVLLEAALVVWRAGRKQTRLCPYATTHFIL